MPPGITKVFIVRPFGTKEGVDFDAIDSLLIRPAIERAQFEGFTTSTVIEAGNIREDMFGFLVTADIIVADVSIHNANVFYELGIRHGLRPRATVMIRAQIDDLKHPFDLQTDRYLVYDHSDPAKMVDDLATTLRATYASGRTDSPVYQLLPKLVAPDPSVLKAVPREFGEEVLLAARENRRGDLRLLAHEALWFPWATEGLRAVGQAQFMLKAFEGARETYEALIENVPNDVEANLRMATIYQRLGKLPQSDAALDRVLDQTASRREDLAEAFALRARNLKDTWTRTFAEGAPAPATPGQRAAALRAGQLRDAESAYSQGFSNDLNAFYPGLNALSLLRIRVDLAKTLPEVWNNVAESDDPDQELLNEIKRFDQLAGAVQMSVEASRQVLERDRTPDPVKMMWLEISEADLAFLVSNRPGRVAQRYREALQGKSGFPIHSARAQLNLFARLGVRSEFASEALKVIDELGGAPPSTQPQAPAARMLLFTGHMVDAPDRKPPPRFPNTKRAETEARRLIQEAIEKERKEDPRPLVGIAGGACGGDILFHEVCAQLGIKTELFLALPQDQFAAASVVHGGPDWVERYWRLTQQLDTRVLSQSKELPRWLRAKTDYSIWQRNNLWMLFNALATESKRVTLIALWNGAEGDGPGGTGDLVEQTRTRGQKTVVLDAKPLAELT